MAQQYHRNSTTCVVRKLVQKWHLTILGVASNDFRPLQPADPDSWKKNAWASLVDPLPHVDPAGKLWGRASWSWNDLVERTRIGRHVVQNGTKVQAVMPNESLFLQQQPLHKMHTRSTMGQGKTMPKASSRCFSCSTLAQAATSSWKAFQWDARLNGPISVDSMLGIAADHSNPSPTSPRIYRRMTGFWKAMDRRVPDVPVF